MIARTRWLFCTILIALVFLSAGTVARAQYDENSSDRDTPRPLQQFADSLPPAVSENLDLEGWIWLSYMKQQPEPEDQTFWDGEFSLALARQ